MAFHCQSEGSDLARSRRAPGGEHRGAQRRPVGAAPRRSCATTSAGAIIAARTTKDVALTEIVEMVLRTRAKFIYVGGRQTTARARVAGMAGDQAARRQGADRRGHRHQDQPGRAPRARRPAGSSASPASSARSGSSPAPTADSRRSWGGTRATPRTAWLKLTPRSWREHGSPRSGSGDDTSIKADRLAEKRAGVRMAVSRLG